LYYKIYTKTVKFKR